MQQEVERAEVGKLEALHPAHHALEVARHPGRRDFANENLIELGSKRDEADVRRIALVTRPGVRQMAELEYLFSSHAAMTSLAESYAGTPFEYE